MVFRSKSRIVVLVCTSWGFWDASIKILVAIWQRVGVVCQNLRLVFRIYV